MIGPRIMGWRHHNLREVGLYRGRRSKRYPTLGGGALTRRQGDRRRTPFERAARDERRVMNSEDRIRRVSYGTEYSGTPTFIMRSYEALDATSVIVMYAASIG